MENLRLASKWKIAYVCAMFLLVFYGFGNGVMTVAFAVIIATDNAAPSATGSLIIYATTAALSWLTVATLAVFYHISTLDIGKG